MVEKPSLGAPFHYPYQLATIKARAVAGLFYPASRAFGRQIISGGEFDPGAKLFIHLAHK